LATAPIPTGGEVMEIPKDDWETLLAAFGVWSKTEDYDMQADTDFALAAQAFVENVEEACPKEDA